MKPNLDMLDKYAYGTTNIFFLVKNSEISMVFGNFLTYRKLLKYMVFSPIFCSLGSTRESFFVASNGSCCQRT